jgi:hypothetical protein
VAASFTGGTHDVRIPCTSVMVRAGVPSAGTVAVPPSALWMTELLLPTSPHRAAESLSTILPTITGVVLLAASIRAGILRAIARRLHGVSLGNLKTLCLWGGMVPLLVIPY